MCIARRMCRAVWGGAYHVEAEDTSGGGAIRFDHMHWFRKERSWMHANESCSRVPGRSRPWNKRGSACSSSWRVDRRNFVFMQSTNRSNDAGANPQFPKDRYALHARGSVQQHASGAAVVGGFSTSTGFLVPGGGRSFSREEINPTLYRACMTARGYN